jgi:16S rRNA (guanine966-N2)-methyltransferase
MAKKRRGSDLKSWKSNRAEAGVGKLRIVGGKYRGRLIQYSGDPVTRPMKDHTREALFNLVGGWVKEKACFDLFAGTGAIGIESISRGASQALLVERHIPTVRIIRENVQSIDPEMNVQIEGSDSFFWVRDFIAQQEKWPLEPWVVFCCPPYALFQEKGEAMIQMIESMLNAAPQGSLIAVESDADFDSEQLPLLDGSDASWEARHYAPAVIYVFKKQ